MYSSIRIQGYRGLDSFRLCGLGRVNLLVGTNGCGKTSILECIELLRAAGQPSVLSGIAGRRGEWARAGDVNILGSPVPRPNLVDLSHLFANRGLENEIRIQGERTAEADPDAWNDRVTICVQAPPPAGDDELGTVPGMEDDDARRVLRVSWSDARDDHRAGVTETGLLPASLLQRALHDGPCRNPAHQQVRFVTTGGLRTAEIVEALRGFVLTPREEAVTEALRSIEPAVERIAPVEGGRINRDAPGGVVVKLRGVPNGVPIGSMGEGVWRMLGLAVAVAEAEGGVLLIDDIGAGLHYSVMEGMWRMLGEQAAALSVQIFATTQSLDCCENLSAIATSGGSGVTIQRIEPGRSEAVRLGGEAVVAAAERGTEVR